MKKTLFRTIALAFSIVLTCSACENTVKESSNASAIVYNTSDKCININYYTWADESVYANDACDAFNALHTDINVTLNILPNEDYDTNLGKLLCQSNNEIDVFGVKGMPHLINDYENGGVFDITDYVKSDIQSGVIDIASYGTMINDITYHDKYLALPTRSTCWVLYYNKTLFDHAGIPYPSQITWDEYRTLASSLTSEKNGQKIWGGLFVDWLPNLIAIQHGQYLTDDNQNYSKESIAFFNTLYNIDQSHVSYEIMNKNNDSFPYELFESGSVAMELQGEWMVNILLDDKTNVDWDIAPMPVDDDVPSGTTTGQYQLAGISSSCKYPEQAYAFLSFLSGKSGASIYAQNAIIPAYTDNDIISLYTQATDKDSTHYFFEAQKYSEQLPINGYSDTIISFSSAADRYYSGQCTLDEAMADFNYDREEIFRKLK